MINDRELSNSEKSEKLNLKKARGDIKRQLTASEEVIASIDIKTHFESLNLQDRLDKHYKLWDKFDKIQSALDSNLEDETAVENECERTEFENRYHTICGIFKKYIKNPSFTLRQTESSKAGLPLTNSMLGNDSNITSFQSNSNSPSRDALSDRDSTSNLPESHPNIHDVEGSQEIRAIRNESRDQNQDQLRFRARFELPKL